MTIDERLDQLTQVVDSLAANALQHSARIAALLRAIEE
jgi:hypothetical protein